MASGLITTFFLGATALGFDEAGFFDLAADFFGFSAAFTLDDFLIVALLFAVFAFGKVDF